MILIVDSIVGRIPLYTSLFSFFNSLLEIFHHCLLLHPLLLCLLLLQQPLFLSSLVLSSLLSGSHVLLSFLLIFLQLFGIGFGLHQLLLKMFEHFNDPLFGILFDPLLHQFAGFILFCGLNFVNHHISEVVAQNLPHLISTFRIILVLILA